MESGEARRSAFEAAKPIHVVLKEECERAGKQDELVDAIDPFADPDLVHSSTFITNSRGVSLFAQRWIPKDNNIKALVFFCHGYSDNCSFLPAVGCARLARSGFAVFGLDYEGHGRSDGLFCLIRNFENLIDDIQEYSRDVKAEFPYVEKRFLWGVSMGGAVSLKLSLREPERWTGMVLMSPMCRVQESRRPSPLVTSILRGVAWMAPTWKLVPSTGSITSQSVSRPEVFEATLRNPCRYTGNMRLATGVQLLDVTIELEERLHEVTVPFLVHHGDKDMLTDPEVSEALYQRACSADKTFVKVADGFHALLWDSLPIRSKIYEEVIEWLNKRC